MTAFVVVLDAVAVAVLLHTIVNAVLLRRPPQRHDVDERVSVLVPMRDEREHAAACLHALQQQRGLGDLELLVYDDGSTDGTAGIVTELGVKVLTGPPPATGELGKPVACTRLAEAATGSVLVFVDADVVLAPDAVARAVGLLRHNGLQFVSPYPRQLAKSAGERLVQPLLQWSWLSFQPLRVAEKSRRESLAAANGQLLVVDTAAYRASGGHAAVTSNVLDDIALARLLRKHGGRGGFADGSGIAQCRMYDGTRALVDGYAKSLWHAFGTGTGASWMAAFLVVLYVVPWLLVPWYDAAWPAALAGTAGRVVTDVRTRSRVVPDSLLHPLSILAFAALVTTSLRRRRSGTLTWKGRPIP